LGIKGRWRAGPCTARAARAFNHPVHRHFSNGSARQECAPSVTIERLRPDRSGSFSTEGENGHES
jgi:hypothetical protein